MKDKDYDIIIAYLQGDLSSKEEEELISRLSKDESLASELKKFEALYSAMDAESSFEVPADMHNDFDQILRAEKDRMRQQKTWINWAGRVAAAVTLVAIGVIAGSYFSSYSDNEAEMLALEQEIKANRELILQSLNQSSASQRFMGVRATNKIAELDREVINALVQIMNHDDNTNVRLAAVRALASIADNEFVRDALLQSLLNQSDPLVQVALIEVMVELEEKRAIPGFERIIESDTIIQTVKDEAYWGVMKLS